MDYDDLIARRPPEGKYWTLAMERERLRRLSPAARAEEAREREAKALQLQEERKEKERLKQAAKDEAARLKQGDAREDGERSKRVHQAVVFYYREYKKTDEWHAIRDEVLQRDGFICKDCGAPAEYCCHCLAPTDGGIPVSYNLFASCRSCMNERQKRRNRVKLAAHRARASRLQP